MEVKNFQRVDYAKPIEAVEFRMGCFTNKRIHVNRINGLNVFMHFHNASNGSEHPVHRLAQIFPSMGRNKDKKGIRCPVKHRMCISRTYGSCQRIDAGVTSDPNPISGLTLRKQIIASSRGGCKIPVRHDIHGLTIELLGPGAIDIICSKPGLNMPNGNLHIKTRKCRREGSGRVSVDKHTIRTVFLKYLL